MPLRDHLNGICRVYGELLASLSGWTYDWLHHVGSRAENGFVAMVSPDERYMVSPEAAVEREFAKRDGSVWRLWERIRDHDLPDVPEAQPGAFLNLDELERNPERALRDAAARGQARAVESAGSGPAIFDEAVYRRFVERWGAPLPEAYLEFLRNFGGTAPENACFEVVPGDWGSEWADVFTMQEHAPQTSLMQVFDWRGIPLMPRMLPIGGDGAFGYVLMSFREGEAGAIYFCATHTDDGSVEYYESQGYWKVADGFPEFVAGLEAGDA